VDGSGPLAGTRVLEVAGLGPGPFAAMLLADLGADVVRVDRPDPEGAAAAGAGPHPDLVRRGRRSVAIDLKHTAGRELVLDLVDRSDVLLEGFRPGVMERLGLGPDECLGRNPRLVYGRMTGWGQDGPLAAYAGHDIDYIAVTGALAGIGRAGELPVPPINLVGDLGGGALFLALGVVCALLETARSGRGQVVDAAIVDGTAVLTTFVHGLRRQGLWPGGRGHNLLDSGAPFYDVYACADGELLAVGALEPQFYAELVERSGLATTEATDPSTRGDPAGWEDARAEWARLFATRPRAEWVALLAESDACVAPVLGWDEAADHPQLAARGTFVEHDGVVQPAPAPRFGRTPAALGRPAPRPGQDTDYVLAGLGLDAARVAELRAAGVVG
jgi:alpha-methylacyl-CoA racemase